MKKALDHSMVDVAYIPLKNTADIQKLSRHWVSRRVFFDSRKAAETDIPDSLRSARNPFFVEERKREKLFPPLSIEIAKYSRDFRNTHGRNPEPDELNSFAKQYQDNPENYIYESEFKTRLNENFRLTTQNGRRISIAGNEVLNSFAKATGVYIMQGGHESAVDINLHRDETRYTFNCYLSGDKGVKFFIPGIGQISFPSPVLTGHRGLLHPLAEASQETRQSQKYKSGSPKAVLHGRQNQGSGQRANFIFAVG